MAVAQEFPGWDISNGYQGLINDESDFKAKRELYISMGNTTTSEADDDGFPSTADGQRQLVQRVVTAMLRLGDAEDRNSKIVLGRISRLGPFELELMGWTVILDVRDIQRGKISLPTWGKSWPAQDFESFHERFEEVLGILQKRKTAVASLFEFTFSKRLALNPAAETRTKRTNANGNGKKQLDKNQLSKKVSEQEQQLRELSYKSSEASGTAAADSVVSPPSAAPKRSHDELNADDGRDFATKQSDYLEYYRGIVQDFKRPRLSTNAYKA